MDNSVRSVTDIAAEDTAWIDAEMWARVQLQLPIVCVDILPMQTDACEAAQGLPRIGLILRETPHQGRKWCTLGGRLRYGESIAQGIVRQVSETLGLEAEVDGLPVDVQPLYVSQYAPTAVMPAPGFDAIDPRKHAIGLTYAAELTGVLKPAGEALDFRWFEWYDIPNRVDIGFQQHGIIQACMDRWLATRC